MKPHLSNDQLLDRLYGLGDAEEHRHLSECAECAQRMESFEARRAEAASASRFSAEPSGAALAAQRRAVYARLETPARMQGQWAPAALAAVLVLVIGVLLYHPSRPAPRHSAYPATTFRPIPAARPEMTDEQLFSVVYAMEESAEPQAAAPIHALFEGDDIADQQ